MPAGMADEILMIGCRPPSHSATYDLYIQDEQDGWEIFRRDNLKGVYSETPSQTVPVWGDNAVYISGCSVDGVAIVRVVYR